MRKSINNSRKSVRKRGMKKVFACMLGLSMIPMNGFPVMAATEQNDQSVVQETTKKESLNQENQIAVQSDANDTEDKVSFAKESTTVKMGHFQKFEFEGVDSGNIDWIDFESSNPEVLEMKEMHTYTADDENITVYMPIAKKEKGSSKISATIHMEDGTKKDVPETEFTVQSADKNIVPLTNYYVYGNLMQEDDEWADENADGQISYDEMEKVTRIEMDSYSLTDADIACLEYAKNCTYIDLEYNSNISDISFMKDMSNLTTVLLEDTSVKDISVLKDKAKLNKVSFPSDVSASQRVALIKNKSIDLHAGKMIKNPIRPKGLFDTAYVGFEAEDGKIIVTNDDGQLILKIADGVTAGTSNLIIKDTENNKELTRISVNISEGKDNKDDFGFVNSEQTIHIGYFGKIELKNADEQNVDIQIKSKNPDILEVVNYDDDDDDTYYYEPRKEGSAILEAEITDENGESFTSEMKVSVQGVQDGIVPLTRYRMYSGLRKSDNEGVADQNHDYQISYAELQDASKISWSGIDLRNSDVEVLKYATNCKELSLYDNPEITQIGFVKNMTKLEQIDIECTGVTDISALRGIKDQLVYLWAPDQLDVQSRYEFINDVVYAKASSEYDIDNIIKPSHILSGKDYELKSADTNILEVKKDYDGYYYVDIKNAQEGNVANLEITCEGQTKVVKVVVTGEDGKVTIHGITMNKSSISLNPGQSEQLNVSYLPSVAIDRSVTWTSSNNAIASVDANGKVTANAAGTAVITATTPNGKTAQCTVTVANPPAQPSTPVVTLQKVEKITIKGISKNIAAGKKIKLTASAKPDNAANKTVTWTTSNKKVATVNASGVVSINKKAAGKSVTIIATAKDGSGKKASYKIKVMKGAVKKVKISGKKSIKAGKTLKLKGKVTASKGANKKLTWTSSNTNYATVSSSGKVKALKAGKKKSVKITAMATDGSGKKATVTIKIK